MLQNPVSVVEWIAGMARGWLRWDVQAPHLQDVGVAMDVAFPSVWMVATDGTLWTLPSPTGGNAHQVASPGPLARVAVSPDGSVWCVEKNGALWIHRPASGSWTKATPHRQSDGAAFQLSALDIAVGNDRRAWVVQDKGGGIGWIWSTVDGATFAFGDAFGFKRVSGGVSNDVWVVDMLNRIVTFPHTSGQFGFGVDTNGRNMVDVSAGFEGDVWMVGVDGSAWKTSDRGTTFLKLGDGFVAISAGRFDSPWGVKADGTLWLWNDLPVIPSPVAPAPSPPGLPPSPPPPSQPRPVIEVTTSGAGESTVFTVSGKTGFLGGAQVTIRGARIGADGASDFFWSTFAANDGTFAIQLSIPCVPGITITFTANDGRPDPSDFTNRFWSLPVNGVCPG